MSSKLYESKYNNEEIEDTEANTLQEKISERYMFSNLCPNQGRKRESSNWVKEVEDELKS